MQSEEIKKLKEECEEAIRDFEGWILITKNDFQCTKAFLREVHEKMKELIDRYDHELFKLKNQK